MPFWYGGGPVKPMGLRGIEVDNLSNTSPTLTPCPPLYIAHGHTNLLWCKGGAGDRPMTARKSDQDAEAKDETSVTGRRPACERRVSSLVAVRVARHVPGLSRIRPERVRFGAVVHSHVYQHFGTRVLACASGGGSVTCSKIFHPYLL